MCIRDRENKINFLTTENQRLVEMRNDKENESESWRAKFQASEQQRTWELEELKIQFETYKRNVLDKDNQIKWDAERASYETQIMQLKQRITELENRLLMLAADNDRINQIASDRLKDIEALKAKCNSLETGSFGEMEELRSQLEMYKRSNLDIRELTLKFGAEKQGHETQIRQLKQVIENNAAEIEKVYELMNVRKKENENLIKQCDDARREVLRLTNELKNLETENILLRNKLEQLARENEDLAHQRESYKAQMERMSQELSRKNRELSERIQELDVLKARYQESMNDYAGQTTKLITRLTMKASTMGRESGYDPNEQQNMRDSTLWQCSRVFLSISPPPLINSSLICQSIHVIIKLQMYQLI
eukprot:TRINITY_DN9586_c0_g1_i5.p1 TRINITY_DN9586_c0_g1~~TRINITY_DN9586_c0_g1_i5.p1  ORF type:complete len:365 (+),score=43.31 TRINITY_DN9586_c0_g1_i5:64-1158(+)